MNKQGKREHEDAKHWYTTMRLSLSKMIANVENTMDTRTLDRMEFSFQNNHLDDLKHGIYAHVRLDLATIARRSI